MKREFCQLSAAEQNLMLVAAGFPNGAKEKTLQSVALRQMPKGTNPKDVMQAFVDLTSVGALSRTGHGHEKAFFVGQFGKQLLATAPRA